MNEPVAGRISHHAPRSTLVVNARVVNRQGFHAMSLFAKLSGWYAQKRPASHMYWRNLCYRLRGSSDGLPIPPDRLVHLVQGSFFIPEFIDSGRAEARELVRLFAKHGQDTARPRAFLDFGCGAGRVIRHLKSWEGVELHGTDYNTDQVRWCGANLPFATFAKNELRPPLTYADASFDFILANSVFTHLSEPLQFAWIDELQRILRPGGCLVITTMGEKMAADNQQPWTLGYRAPEALPRFHAGEMIALGEDGLEVPDEYQRCTAYHPESYVRGRLARGLEVVEFMPDAVFGYGLDAYVLRKPLAVLQSVPAANR